MDKAVGEAGRPLMLCGARLYIITKKILTPDGLNLKEVDRRKEYENEFE